MSGTERLSAPPGGPTGSYDGTGTFSPAPPAPSAVGPGAEPSQDLRDLLRRRLLTISVLGLCLSVAAAGAVTPGYVASSSWDALAFFWFLVAVPATALAVLLAWRRIPLRGLRVIELTAIGLLVGAHVFHTVTMLVSGRELALFVQLSGLRVGLPNAMIYELPYPRLIAVLAAWYSLYWVGLIVGYGLVFPNTWQRTTVVVSAIALTAILLNGVICWRDPDVSREDMFWFMLVIVGAVSFAAAMVVFCTHRIDRLRQAAVAARRLGQYQLKDLLGRGGMGEVYRAEHLLLRRPCAIKLIRAERAGDPQTLRRFEREVQATATLTNWHSVEIYDYGHAADGTFYYVMEYLPGLTLDELVRRHGPLLPGRAVHLLRQVCAALREAHAIGLIHRDIKPGNVIVGERGGLSDVAKLLDFGLVRPAGLAADGEKLTQTGALVGTPAYMSPEQAAEGGEVDARSDIYSLGAVAYFLLTGRPPFVGKTALHVLAAHLREEARPLTVYRGDCPADLQAVVLRSLEKDAERRFPTIDALEEALGRCECAADWDAARAAAWWRDHGRETQTEAP